MAIKYLDKATTLIESGVSYTNKKYNSPLDVRTVVDTYADLDSLRTNTDFSERAYDGMPVTVVNDTDSNNNGLYFYLEKSNKFIKATTGIRCFETTELAENYVASDISVVGELIFVIDSDTTGTYELYKIIEKDSKKIGINILNSECILNTAYKC